MTDRNPIHVDDDDAMKAIRRIEAAVQDLRPFWPILVRLYRGWMQQQFKTEGEFGGHAWQSLSAAYADTKSLRWPGKGILVASGAMKRAVDNPTRKAMPSSLTLTFESDILPYHQSGTEFMPARPVVLGPPLPVAAQAQLTIAAEHYARTVVGRDLLGRF